MSKETAVMVLGIVAAVLPFTGFPEGFRTLLIFACGIALAVIGFLLRQAAGPRRPRGKHLSFVENTAARQPLPTYEQNDGSQKIQ